MDDFYPCGHPRTEANTKLKTGGRRRKDGTRPRLRRCRTCYNAMRLANWHRNNPPKPTPAATWEVEIRIRRNGKLQRRESALGPDAVTALEDLFRDLQDELAAVQKMNNPHERKERTSWDTAPTV